MTTTPSASDGRAKDSYCLVVGVVPDETGQNALLEAWKIAGFHSSAQLHVVRAVEAGGSSDVAARSLEALPVELAAFVRNVMREPPERPGPLRRVRDGLRVDLGVYARGVPAPALLRAIARLAPWDALRDVAHRP